jgi:hypothetical protein
LPFAVLDQKSIQLRRPVSRPTRLNFNEKFEQFSNLVQDLQDKCVYSLCYNLRNMGQIIIEIPQDVNRAYRIVSENTAKKLLETLERHTEKEQENEDILGLWTAPKPLAKKKTV